ncbi:MAG: alpha-ketoglutarate-dependent dioxygenase AlkB [Alphaproteobacteria bacterium]|nr:alpha-ketoglutarate-dependent dioxygenase AlkB [Alphaproteobacteria bacterium]
MSLLFNIADEKPNIEGLQYLPDYITGDNEATLIQAIDSQPWITDLKRRVQHYGYRYDYKARAVNADAYLGELPEWLQALTQQLYTDKIFSELPDQVIVNEYMSGQGISAHIDCVPCFAETIASLSLGSDCIMQFHNPQSGQKCEQVLERRSLVILSGAARYEWTHAIPARKSDIIQGIKIERSRRLSLTFRKMLLK